MGEEVKERQHHNGTVPIGNVETEGGKNKMKKEVSKQKH